jgi:hypothetical protein
MKMGLGQRIKAAMPMKRMSTKPTMIQRVKMAMGFNNKKATVKKM